VNVGELTYKGLTWSGVEVDVRYREGVLQLPDIRATFVQGTLRAKGEVDLRPKIPHVSLTSRLDRAATEPLVKALALGSWKLTSGLDFDGQTEFVGLAWPDALGSASGSGRSCCGKDASPITGRSTGWQRRSGHSWRRRGCTSA
jgi:hypothetical protein